MSGVVYIAPADRVGQHQLVTDGVLIMVSTDQPCIDIGKPRESLRAELHDMAAMGMHGRPFEKVGLRRTMVSISGKPPKKTNARTVSGPGACVTITRQPPFQRARSLPSRDVRGLTSPRTMA